MSLAKHLATQQRSLQCLIERLEEEQLLLSAPEVDGQRLADLAAAKQALLVEIEFQESQRRNAQLRLGYGTGRQGAERAAEDANCLPAWQQLRELTSHAQWLNRLNGNTIHIRLTHNQRILNFLHEATGCPLYGPDGRSRRNGSLPGR